MPYNHLEIEKKWQDKWEDSGLFHAKDNSDKQKFYCLIEFPYPSGVGLHIGHLRSNTAMDIIARKRRMEGFNVLYPIGWDAFGLPTENYAIKTGRKPQDVTKENVATFKQQLQSIGFSFDWSREINTTDPDYYKWTQWMFLEFYKAGLAYKDKVRINWCLSCKIGLANEEVVEGKCERCGGEIEKRDKEQWMIAITKYADRLLEDLETVDYLDKIKTQQVNWIGKSEGAVVKFEVLPPFQGGTKGGLSVGKELEVFTTRPDTLFGATYMVLAPEHPLVDQITTDEQRVAVEQYVKEAKAQTDIDRQNIEKEKTGIFTGAYAINPVNEEEIPIWVADYVMMGYGTGAIMAVPAHDERDSEFAKKFGQKVIKVIAGETIGKEVYTGDGKLINSSFLNGLLVSEAKEAIIEWLEENGKGKRSTSYKLRDWVFSRQRYWGEPIPLVFCEQCAKQEVNSKSQITNSRNAGWVPVEDLPVELPEVEKYEPTDTGESPLAAIEDWVNTTCPKCKGPAKRETDTMPNWAGSSWYFLAYIMKGISENYQFSITKYQSQLKKWMPVDWYNGGMEHTVLHLLYSRFWNKFLFDQGHVPTSEPYAKRTSHGLILAEDGSKMSKSKGNVVNPDELVTEYGADAVRLYQMFMGPFSEPVPWSMNGLIGMRRFLEKATNLSGLVKDTESKDVTKSLHQTIRKVTNDIEKMRFNTAVSQMMIFVNLVKEQGSITKESLVTFLTILCPFAPHLTNELYESLGGKEFLETLSWPEFDEKLAKEELVEVAVQINGKVRSSIMIAPEADEEAAKELALADENVIKHLDGKEIKKVIYVQGRILNLVV